MGSESDTAVWEEWAERPPTTVLVKYDDGDEQRHDLGKGRNPHPWEWVLEERPPGKVADEWLSGKHEPSR